MAETLRGGGSVGPSLYFGYHGSWPFASVTVDYDAITFKVFPLTYRIEKQYIRHIVEDQVLWTSYIRIVHINPKFPKWITFKPWNMSDLTQMLGRHNYQVESSDVVRDMDDSAVEYTNPFVFKIGIYVFILATLAGLWAAHHARKMVPAKRLSSGIVQKQ